MRIRLGEIDANPDQPRKIFDAEKLRELADSIAQVGLLQPITVRPNGGRWLIIAGERRWRAAQLAGLDTIETVVVEGLDDRAAFVLSVTENLARHDMTMIEEARAFARLEQMGMGRAEVAAAFGKNQVYITWRIGLLTLIPAGVELVEKGQLGANLAWQVAQLQTTGQAHVIRRWLHGEFRRTNDAVAYAKTMLAAEAQDGLFGDAAEDSAPRRAARAVHRGAAEGTMRRISELHLQVDGIAECPPGRFAESSPDLLDRYEFQLAELARSVRRAQATIRTAKATTAIIMSQNVIE